MDILFSKAQRQATALRNDVDRIADSSTSLNLSAQQGQFTASWTTLNKTLNDLEEMVKRETSMEKRSTYKERLAALRREAESVKASFNEIKQAQKTAERQQLLSSTPQSTAYRGGVNPSSNEALSEALLREKESRTLASADTNIDHMLLIGQSTLESLRSQRGTLKSVQKRVLDAAAGLGVSKHVIRVIERKSAQDRWIFWGGVCLTLLIIYLFWRYFSSSSV